MEKQTDSNVEKVIAALPFAIDGDTEQLADEFRKRAEFGLTKYGVTTDREDLSKEEWLTHCIHEFMDSAIYLQKLRSMEPDNSGKGMILEMLSHECLSGLGALREMRNAG